MKLRFKNNSVRLRLNQSEVRAVASGTVLAEHVHFPGNACVSYVLESAPRASARFENGDIRIAAAAGEVTRWAESEDVGIYFDLPVSGEFLKVAIEKDLECLEGPLDGQDPDAFPRNASDRC